MILAHRKTKFSIFEQSYNIYLLEYEVRNNASDRVGNKSAVLYVVLQNPEIFDLVVIQNDAEKELYVRSSSETKFMLIHNNDDVDFITPLTNP
ncbi:unnamed protein product [Rotaria magnacalcarata]|uniref:Uncharacterized protein n=2 Tax=Rotaria magnacalcarata TaxID=392030 RepID=A0A8S3HNB5_9BILA|nr:unnamed protein product [Rotaria magnacalcarata]